MNWLEHARREIGAIPAHTAAKTADGHPTAAMAVLRPLSSVEPGASIDGNGSLLSARMHDSEALREAFAERAAIMEYDGGLSRDDAERAAGALVLKQRRLH